MTYESISEKLKFDYLMNKKSFRYQLKNFFPCFKSALFKLSKQETSKIVVDTTFKVFLLTFELDTKDFHVFNSNPKKSFDI